MNRITAAATPPSTPILPQLAQLDQQPRWRGKIKRSAAFVHAVARRCSRIATTTLQVRLVETSLLSARSPHAGELGSEGLALPNQFAGVRLDPGLELLKAQSYTNIAPGGSLTADQSVAGVPYFRDDSIDGVATFHR